MARSLLDYPRESLSDGEVKSNWQAIKQSHAGSSPFSQILGHILLGQVRQIYGLSPDRQCDDRDNSRKAPVLSGVFVVTRNDPTQALDLRLVLLYHDVRWQRTHRPTMM